jgi:sugar-specific transcriptional regulator TrmB
MKASTLGLGAAKIRDLLMEVGLTDTEALIYMCGIGVESMSVQEIGAETGIKRPTIYHALHTLTDKGLVTEVEHAEKTGFRMNAPTHLLAWVQKQKEELDQKENIVHRLSAQLAASGSHASDARIVAYTDAKNVQSLFDLAFFARSKQCVVVAPSESFIAEFDPDGTRARGAAARGVSIRTLIQKDVDSALLLYDDTVALIDAKQCATVITSKTLCAILISSLI